MWNWYSFGNQHFSIRICVNLCVYCFCMSSSTIFRILRADSNHDEFLFHSHRNYLPLPSSILFSSCPSALLTQFDPISRFLSTFIEDQQFLILFLTHCMKMTSLKMHTCPYSHEQTPCSWSHSSLSAFGSNSRSMYHESHLIRKQR